MSSALRRVLVIVAIVLAAAAVWLSLRGDEREPAQREVAEAKQPRTQSGTPDRERDGDDGAKAKAKVERKAKVSKRERDELHRRIVDALEKRSSDPDPHPSHGSHAAPSRDEPVGDENAPREKIRNRLGDDDGWGDLLSSLLTDDFGPLADECIADARERVPDLAGMVAIEFTVVADEEIGGVVESADAAPDNEIADAGFLECMRETMLSAVMPPPPGSGRRDVVLSLHVDPVDP